MQRTSGGLAISTGRMVIGLLALMLLAGLLILTEREATPPELNWNRASNGGPSSTSTRAPSTSVKASHDSWSPTVRVSLNDKPVQKLKIETTSPGWIGNRDPIQSNQPLVITWEKMGVIRAGEKTWNSALTIETKTESGLIWVDRHAYHGSIVIHATREGLVAINHVSLEDYIASVINSEMPSEFGVEARKAQAIASRTFVLAEMEEAASKGREDVNAGVRSQRYVGALYRDKDGRKLAGESTESRRIARETAGIVCTDQKGKVFTTFYCSTCGGGTVRGREVFPKASPILEQVACDFCRGSPNYRWELRIPREELHQALGAYLKKEGESGGEIVQVSMVRSGFLVQGKQEKQEITGAVLRSALGSNQVKSPRCSLVRDRNDYLIRGKGYGHGVGLCQYGARELSRKGWNGLQILSYYYPGAQFVRLTKPR